VDHFYSSLQQIWDWILAHWEGVSSTVLLGGIGLYLTYLQVRQGRVAQQVEFRKALNEGHDFRMVGEGKWENLAGKDECENALRNADRAYQNGYDYAHGRKQRAVICFYRMLCAEQLGRLAGSGRGRDCYFAESCKWRERGLRLSQCIMTETALKEARDYTSRDQRSRQKNSHYEEMAKFLYSLAQEWTGSAKRKAAIAFELGCWLLEVEDPHNAKEAFQCCRKLYSQHERVFYWEAMTDIELQNYQSAEENLLQHLKQYPHCGIARAWLNDVQDERKRSKEVLTEDVVP
jgi:hypothetical protein